MSIKHLNLVLGYTVDKVRFPGVKLRPGRRSSAVYQRLVLAKLADHADESGVAWPAVSTIAADLHISRGGVVHALDALEDQDLIVAMNGRSGGRRPTRWQLVLPTEPTTPVNGSHGAGAGMAQSEPGRTDNTSTRLGGEQPATPASQPSTPASQPRTPVVTNHPEPPRNVSGVGGGVGGALPRVGPSASTTDEEQAAQILAEILAARPEAHGNFSRVVKAISGELAGGLTAGQIFAAAAGSPPSTVKSWPRLLESRVKDARWSREAPTAPSAELSAELVQTCDRLRPMVDSHPNADELKADLWNRCVAAGLTVSADIPLWKRETTREAEIALDIARSMLDELASVQPVAVGDGWD